MRLAADLRRGVVAEAGAITLGEPSPDLVAQQADHRPDDDPFGLRPGDLEESLVHGAILQIEDAVDRVVHELQLEMREIAGVEMRVGDHRGIDRPRPGDHRPPLGRRRVDDLRPEGDRPAELRGDAGHRVGDDDAVGLRA